MTYALDNHVPIAGEGTTNRDFMHKLPGHDYRQPKADMNETRRLRAEAKEREMQTQRLEAEKPPAKIGALDRTGTRVDEQPREPKQKGFQAQRRHNAGTWFQAPHYEQAPLQKEEGETWNSYESMKVQGTLKAQDRLMRSVWSRDDIGTPMSDTAGDKHPLNHDKEEYYLGRSAIDGDAQEASNDFQIRPVNLPDFHNPPPPGADKVTRMRRLREVMKQRYAGRPRLMGVFRNCALTKPGFAFPKDLQMVFDQMGIKVDEDECQMLVQAVDKDQKGAVTFDEFADLVLGPDVEIGGPPHQAQDRHVRNVTRTLVQGLVDRGQALGKAFCELDPERRYLVSKAQFANAVGTAANHVSKQAIEFLWASQFPGEAGDHANRVIDWREFMSQLAHFAHSNRAPTPICVQGRKRQYDLLQRTAPLTGGDPGLVELNRPDQDKSDDIQIIADKIVQRQTDLPHKPRHAMMLTEPYVEMIRAKAERTERALPKRIPKSRMRELLKDREMVHQDELAKLLIDEMAAPGAQKPLGPQAPVYASHPSMGANVLTLDPASLKEATSGEAASPPQAAEAMASTMPSPQPGAASLKLVPADINSYVATQRTNRDDEIQVEEFITNLYKPEDERHVIHRVNDGLNRALRGHRPPRERPAHIEVPRHENYWQARYVMELIGDAISAIENSNGGKLKPSKMFKRLDIDGDGFISMSDLKTACDKFKIPHTSSDLHAVFSALDKHDAGSVNIGEFTRNYEMHQGNLMDAMARPIKAVYHEGGIEYAGPVQDKINEMEAQVAAAHAENEAAHAAHAAGNRSTSAPPSRPDAASPRSTAGSSRSQMCRTGMSIATPSVSSSIYEREVGLITGQARVTDVIRARCAAWKPSKHEIFTAPAKTRYGMTVFPDTRHVTEHNMPLSASYMPESERFKTTNSVHSLFAVPDARTAQVEDAMKKHARNEFRVERIRQRQREFTERCWAANQAAQEFDELKVARKALNQLNYERKCKMACA